MKIQCLHRRVENGFTMADAMMAVALTGVVASITAYFLINGVVLFAKNMAENVAHDQNRIAISRLVHDIHAAVSIPQLGRIVPGNLASNPTAPPGSWTPFGTNVTFWAETGSGPSAGISFKKMGNAANPNGGPFRVTNDTGNQDMIKIDSGGKNTPHPGMDIIFPYWGMEGTIDRVTSNGAHHFNIWVAGGLETRIKEKGSQQDRELNPIICYYMSRFAYVVENGQLHFYSTSQPPAGVTWPVVVARNIINEADRAQRRAAFPATQHAIRRNQPHDRGQPLQQSQIQGGQYAPRRFGSDPRADLENTMKTATRSSAESGSSMMVVLGTVTTLAAFVAIAVDYTTNIGRNAQRDRVFANAVEIGDGCLELAFGSWRRLSATAEAPSTNTFKGVIPTPSPGNFPSFRNAVISNFAVQAVDPLVTLLSNDPPLSAVLPSASPPQTKGPGSGTFSYFYLATVDVTLPHTSGVRTAKVRRIFEKRYTSAWNWAILYNGDLELHPDSPLTLSGWVHSNEDVYVGNGTSVAGVTPPANLTLTDRLTYAGNYRLGFAPGDSAHNGHVNLQAPVSPADLPPGQEQVYAPFDIKANQFNTTDNNENNDGYRELIEKKSDNGPNSDVMKDKRLYDQANIAITIDASNNVKVYTGTGHSKTEASGNSPNNSLALLAHQAAANAVKPGYRLQDNREVGEVRIVDFDVAQFRSYFPSSTTRGWNGIVHITDLSGSSSTKRGIRVTNGARLPTGGMSVVSSNPVYIKGDFNSGRGSSEPPSNLGDPDDPDAPGYTRQPASIMADAVTLLSNNWSDGASYAGLSARIASNTTVNAALVAGNVPSSGGNYSGGAENFVRFLENWNGKTFTYYGSMLNLYASKHAIGTWGKANVYQPAQLNWRFDKSLSVDSNGEPVKVPGYVSTVAYLQQQRWYLQVLVLLLLSMKAVCLLLLSTFALAAPFAQAGVDFNASTSERMLAGIKFQQLNFTENGRRITYEHPRGWAYSGAGSRIRFTPPGLTQAFAEIDQTPLPAPAPINEDVAKALQQAALASIPPDSLTPALVSEAVNPFRVNNHETYEAVLSYGAFGQEFMMGVIYVRLPDTQLRFCTVARKADFEKVHEAFRSSIFSWQWD